MSILAVIFSHFREDLDLCWTLGHFGVTCFFVISGFLITLLMIRERERSHTVSLSGFYWRRCLRILPAYLVFIGVTFVLDRLGVFHMSDYSFSWMSILTYTSCFMVPSIAWNVGHTWSLSVEEHFYLIWPLLFRWVSSKTAVILLVGSLVAAPFIRWALLIHNSPVFDIDYCSPSQMSSIAVGCLLACVVTRAGWPAAVIRWRRLPLTSMVAGVLLLIFSVVALRSHKTLHHVLMDPMRASAFGLILLGILYGKSTGLLQRLLNSRMMNGIGILSYSLYLWQQPLTYRRLPIGIPLSLATLFAVECLSYFLVEKPFLTLKRKPV